MSFTTVFFLAVFGYGVYFLYVVVRDRKANKAVRRANQAKRDAFSRDFDSR